MPAYKNMPLYVWFYRERESFAKDFKISSFKLHNILEYSSKPGVINFFKFNLLSIPDRELFVYAFLRVDINIAILLYSKRVGFINDFSGVLG